MNNRVLHILNTAKYSGAESVALQIMDLVAPIYESIYVSFDGPIANVVTSRGKAFLPIESMNPRTIKEIVRKTNPRLIHAHDFTASTMTAFANTGVPIISHLHNNPPWIKKPLHPKAMVYAIAVSRIRSVLTVSMSVEEEYVYRKVIGGKTVTLPNVVDGDRVIAMSRVGNRSSFIHSPYVVFLGRLSSQKNPLEFVRIVRAAREAGLDLHAVMIGDGELREEVETLINHSELSNRISLTGFISDPYPLLSQAHALVIPSKWEGFGLAAVEALVLGVPVLASPVGGLKDIVDSSCGALCVETEDYVSELETLSVESNRATKSMLARRRSKLYTDVDAYKDKILNIYRLGEKRQ